MVTKLAELAIVVSLITLSQRLAGYQNKPLGYFLLVIAVVAALFWLYELFGELTSRFSKTLERTGIKEAGRARKTTTIVVGGILVLMVAYPWLHGNQLPTQIPLPSLDQARISVSNV